MLPLKAVWWTLVAPMRTGTVWVAAKVMALAAWRASYSNMRRSTASWNSCTPTAGVMA